jgi:ATP-binding cassette subfamily B protein
VAERKAERHRALWPSERLAEGLTALAAVAGLQLREPRAAPRVTGGAGVELERSIEQLARAFEVQLEPVECTIADVRDTLTRAGPALLHIEHEQGAGFLLLLDQRRRRARCLAPSGKLVSLELDELASQLRASVGGSVRRCFERLETELEDAGLTEHERSAVGQRLLEDELGHAVIRDRCWLLRPPTHRAGRLTSGPRRLLRDLGTMVVAHYLQWLLIALAWAVLGRGLLSGRSDAGWLAAWVLALLGASLMALISGWAQARASVDLGRAIKRKLLLGVLRLDLDRLRGGGAGRFLGRVIESESLESQALFGAFTTLLAVVELSVAMAVLASSGAGPTPPIALALTLIAALLLVALQRRRTRNWASLRLRMSEELTERVLGHRTRRVQQRPAHWHEGEDELLERYLHRSSSLDRVGLWLGALPQAWLLFGLCVLLVPLVAGGAPLDRVSLAIGLGGVLLGQRALSNAVLGANSLIDASVAWYEVAEFVHAAAEAPRHSAIRALDELEREPSESSPILRAHELEFRFPGRTEPQLQGCCFDIGAGDRVLLCGASGAGKSTLAALLGRLRTPNGGLLLLRGIDHRTLCVEDWRRRVVVVPQAHDNHIFAGTLAFNLLLGRRWPAHAEDRRAAEEVCRALGLGELLERMPSGLDQLVGETGWKLSQGEQARVALARALLQEPEVLVLDESFAALDPQTLDQALAYVRSRALALIVIAHP